MEKQENLFLHLINIYHSEILTNLVPAIEDLQANLAMYTELPVKSSLDRLIDDSILTHGFMPVMPGLVIHLQWLKRTEFEYYNFLIIYLIRGHFRIDCIFVLRCLFVYGSQAHCTRKQFCIFFFQMAQNFFLIQLLLHLFHEYRVIWLACTILTWKQRTSCIKSPTPNELSN